MRCQSKNFTLTWFFAIFHAGYSYSTVLVVPPIDVFNPEAHQFRDRLFAL